MKVYLVKELNVRINNKYEITTCEYRSASADYIFTNNKKALEYFNWFTKKGEWEEITSPSGIIRIKKKPYFEKGDTKIYEAYEYTKKTTI